MSHPQRYTIDFPGVDIPSRHPHPVDRSRAARPGLMPGLPQSTPPYCYYYSFHINSVIVRGKEKTCAYPG